MINKETAIQYHKDARGKVSIETTVPIDTAEDLSLAYTPGVGMVSQAIAENKELVWELTGRRNRVGIISDGSAVLGLGNIGPEAAMPVMEGKAALFKQFGNIDAIPICLSTQDTNEIVQTIVALAPTFGGINIEDISAPRCFEIEKRVQEQVDIPIFHDDQHGTAIVVLAGLLNALKVTGRESLGDLKIVLSGAGAAGTAISEILLDEGVKNIIVLDSKGALSSTREDLNNAKKKLLEKINPEDISGSLAEVLAGADVFIGVSAPNILNAEMVKTMAKHPIIFALANPNPEIMPDEAKLGGAAIIATGRSDFPNQINNVLAFPGIFRGALDAKATRITSKMKRAAALALANHVKEPTADYILPNALDKSAAISVAEAVQKAA